MFSPRCEQSLSPLPSDGAVPCHGRLAIGADSDSLEKKRPNRILHYPRSNRCTISITKAFGHLVLPRLRSHLGTGNEKRRRPCASASTVNVISCKTYYYLLTGAPVISRPDFDRDLASLGGFLATLRHHTASVSVPRTRGSRGKLGGLSRPEGPERYETTPHESCEERVVPARAGSCLREPPSASRAFCARRRTRRKGI